MPINIGDLLLFTIYRIRVLVCVEDKRIVFLAKC